MKKLLGTVFTLAVCGALFVSCPAKTTEETRESVQPQEIRVLLANHPYGNLLIPSIPEFERETGIKVLLEHLNENDLTQKLIAEFTEGASTIDVFMTRPMTETLLFLKNDWKKALDSYDLSDYPHTTLEMGFRDDKPHFIPLVVEWQVLYYRKDLLRAAGLRVPTSFEELESTARTLNRDGIAGFGARGAGFPAVSQISSFIYSSGGRFIENGAAAFHSPQAVDAIRLYGRLLGISGPPGVATMSWSELMQIFQTGRLAMWADASVFYGQLIDRESSQVPPENIGVASLPRGPAGAQPYIITSWGMSISSQTRNKDAALSFLTWATSREMAEKAMLANIPMARTSVWSDPSITTHIYPGIVDSMLHASQYGYPYAMPFMTSIVPARNLIGEVIAESINTRGTSPRLQALATQKAAEMNELLRADGEYGSAR